MSLQKATIKLLPEDQGMAKGHPVFKGRTAFKVQFNPTEVTFNKGAQFAEIVIPGLDSPILQFVRGQNEKLTLELFFDATMPEGEERERDLTGQQVDVRDQTRPFYQLVKMQSATHAPPRIEFSWGDLSFQAVVESVQQKYTLFSPAGTPLRATLSLTLREYKTLEQQLKDLKLASADHSKLRVARRGDTLSGIAAKEYGDAGEWRRIAEANRIDNPRRLAPGTALFIPPLAAD